MLFAMIAGIVCIAVGTMMYTPKMRSFKLYKPTAFLFLFEGIWILLDYIFRQIAPDNVFMQVIHCIGLTALGIYFAVCAFLSEKKHEKKSVKKSLMHKK